MTLHANDALLVSISLYPCCCKVKHLLFSHKGSLQRNTGFGEFALLVNLHVLSDNEMSLVD